MIRRWTSSLTATARNPRVQLVFLAGYYLLVQFALFALYAHSDFVAPPYIYQGF